MAQLSIIQTRDSIDTLYHTETDTGPVYLELQVPEGIWSPVSLSLLYYADNLGTKGQPAARLVAGGSSNSVSRTFGYFPQVGDITDYGGDYYAMNWDPTGYIIESSDLVILNGEDNSSSAGTTLYVYLRARRMR
jgi:hypothetical protein